MSKYDPLKRYLETRATEQTPMTFTEVERILGIELPPSARTRAGWWSNNPGTHVGVSAWRDAGWKASRVDVGGEKIVFVREKVPASIAGDDPILLRRSDLSTAGARLVGDYAAEMGGDLAAAVARAVHEAAIARRGRLIDELIATAPRVPAGAPSSLELLHEGREERDGR